MSKRTRSLVTARRSLSANLVVTVVVLVVAVVVIGGVLLFTGQDDAPQGGASTAPGPVPAEVLRGADSHTLTEAADGKVTVVEFLDYQCPACAGYYLNLTNKLERDYAGRITFVTRNFPLDVHPLAVPAAQAAEAAAMQGKYREMYHALYDNYQSWALTPDGGQLSDDVSRARDQFDAYARQIGLDLDRFHQDMNSGAVQQRIDRDRADGKQAGVTSTPTIFINGIQFEPSGNSFADADRQFRETLDKALA